MIYYSYNKCPLRTKYELSKWAQKYFNITRHKANSYKKKQLIAIWHNARKRKEVK